MATRTTTTTSSTIPSGIRTEQTIEQDPQASVEIAIDAKGVPRFSVKEYGVDGYATAHRALDIAIQTARALGIRISTLETEDNGTPRLKGTVTEQVLPDEKE